MWSRYICKGHIYTYGSYIIYTPDYNIFPSDLYIRAQFMYIVRYLLLALDLLLAWEEPPPAANIVRMRNVIFANARATQSLERNAVRRSLGTRSRSELYHGELSKREHFWRSAGSLQRHSSSNCTPGSC